MLEPRITRFPLGRNGRESYNIVYFGDIFQYIGNIANELTEKYVFVFSTTLNNINEDNDYYGRVNIDLIADVELSFFNHTLRKNATHHIYTGGTLVLNDFLEISEEETVNEKIYFAYLKNQKFYKDNKPYYSRDLRVFLFSQGKHSESSFDNLPSSRLAPEFEAKLQLDHYDSVYEYHSDGYRYLCNLKDTVNNDNESQTLENLIQLALEKKEQLRTERSKKSDEYIARLHQCGYHYRNL